MRTQMLKSVRNTLPVSSWAMGVAAAAGLAQGSIYLSESLDLATAVGIAGFLAVAVGFWLAAHLYLLLVRGYTAWISTIETRMALISKGLSIASDEERQRANSARRTSLTSRLVARSFYLTMFSCGAFAYCALTAILLAQFDGPAYGAYLVGAIASFALLAVSVIMQCLYFLHLHRKVASIERQMERNFTIPQVAGRAAVLGASISRTEQFGHRFVGVRPSPTK